MAGRQAKVAKRYRNLLAKIRRPLIAEKSAILRKPRAGEGRWASYSKSNVKCCSHRVWLVPWRRWLVCDMTDLGGRVVVLYKFQPTLLLQPFAIATWCPVMASTL